MTTESQDLGLTSHPKDGAFSSIVSLYWGIRTHTDRRVSTPAGLTNTSSSSNLVFPGVSHPGTDQLSPAQLRWEPVLGCRVIWLPVKAVLSHNRDAALESMYS